MPQSFTDLYLELFAGRPDTYAIRWEWEKDGTKRAIYIPSNYDGDSEYAKDHAEKICEDVGTDKYGKEAALAHMRGSHFLGVYPIHADSTTKFFALDFDKEPEEAWKAAKRQQKIFHDEAGIPLYIERSRSGNGYHLWAFLAEAVNAGLVRHAIAQFIEEQDTYDRMFPNQNGVTEARPLGNLIALPLFGSTVKDGKGVFVVEGADGTPQVVEDQKDYLRRVERIPTSKLEELFDDAPEVYQPERDHPGSRLGPQHVRGHLRGRCGCRGHAAAVFRRSDVDADRRPDRRHPRLVP